MSKYYVIGGQYEFYNYGGSDTILGAKRLAKKNIEYWDNWQGWHIPKIYRGVDCSLLENFYGEQIIPTHSATPFAVHNGKKWVMNMEED
ncbi:MAG: hypothetical protein J6S14_11990 [Clostridia bacterium]|nr:hypothetical protein [Clostridia bacterium]